MRVIAGAFFLATIVLSASARAQQTGPDQSLTRIRTALEAPPPLQQLLAPLPPWVAPGPTHFGLVTFQPPDTEGQMVKVAVPIGALAMRAGRAISNIERRREERKAHDEVLRALQELPLSPRDRP